MTLPHESGLGRNYIICAHGNLIHEIPGMLGLCVCTYTHTTLTKQLMEKSVSDSHFWTEQLILALLEMQGVQFYWYYCADF